MEAGFEETWKIEVKIADRVLAIAFVLKHLPNDLNHVNALLVAHNIPAVYCLGSMEVALIHET